MEPNSKAGDESGKKPPTEIKPVGTPTPKPPSSPTPPSQPQATKPNQTAAVAVSGNLDALQIKGEEITKSVIARVTNYIELGGLTVPDDYNPVNSVRAGMLAILSTEDKNGSKALDVCEKSSVENAIMEMIQKGLNPLRKQCSFVVFGKTLKMMPEHSGNIVMAQRNGLKKIIAKVIYKDDDFDYEIDTDTGLTKITRHKQSMDNIRKEDIKGAYAIMINDDGTVDAEIMTKAEITEAWKMAQGYPTKAHINFPGPMSEKTVINRATKRYIRTDTDIDNEFGDPELNPKNKNATQTLDVEAQEVITDANSATPETKVEFKPTEKPEKKPF